MAGEGDLQQMWHKDCIMISGSLGLHIDVFCVHSLLSSKVKRKVAL